MFDRYMLSLSRPVLGQLARLAVARKITATAITLTGFGIGITAALLIIAGQTTVALIFILASRLCDGLDGAVARASGQQSDLGAFLDIALDFLFYAAIPLAFVILNPVPNAVAGAVLLAAFIGTGTSFLAYAVIAEKRGLRSTAYPSKSFYYLGGLTEGAETIALFLAFCLWPHYFAALAYVYSALCLLTTATRIRAGWHSFSH